MDDSMKTAFDSCNAKVYLGDGAYASWDGYYIKVTTEDGLSVTNTVVLDNDGVNNLLRFIKQIDAVVKQMMSITTRRLPIEEA